MAIDFEGCHGRVPLVNLKSTWLCEVFIRGENWKDDIWVAGGRWLFRSQWTSLGSGGQLGPTPFEGDGYIPGSWKSQRCHGTISYLWKRKQVLKSKQNHAFLNSTPTFYYLTGRVCIWVSISLAYNATSEAFVLKSQHAVKPGSSLTEMFHYCVDSAAISHFECRPHTNDSVLKAVDQVLMRVWNVHWEWQLDTRRARLSWLKMTIKHCFMFLVQQMLNALKSKFWCELSFVVTLSSFSFCLFWDFCVDNE